MTAAHNPDRFGFLHIDLNSFFASVEQQLHPEYRGRPLAVVPTMADTTCCIAASYEAKALGIKTGTQVGEAKRICPDIVLIEGRPRGVCEVLAARSPRRWSWCCPVAHTPSIDEMVCQLMGREQEPPRARKIALEIKQSIYKNVGEALRCSIGMAPNRYLAKIASDMQKPDGLIGLLPSQLPRAIAHLELRDLPGVGAKTEVRLNAKGITHDGAAAGARPHRHAQALGQRVGRPPVPLAARRGDAATMALRWRASVQKSLGHSHVMAPEFRTQEGAWAIAHKLLHKAAMRLRMEKFYTGSMAVTIRFALTKEQAARMKTKRHFSGLTPLRLGHGGALQGLPGHADAARSAARHLGQRPQGEDFQRPFFVGVTLRNLIPGERVSGRALRRSRQSRRALRHHGQAQPEVRPHHAALRRDAARARIRADAHRLHADSGAVRRRLHVGA